jgi:hypothetical protein
MQRAFQTQLKLNNRQRTLMAVTFKKCRSKNEFFIARLAVKLKSVTITQASMRERFAEGYSV